MSWKGFQKAAVRAPQTIKQKFNLGEITKDAVYIDAERRFADLERETKKLHEESRKYFYSINGMLNHQIEFSKACAEIYKPISGSVSDPDSLIPEGNPEGIRACEEYEAIVRELQEHLRPELEMIETRVVKPADELLEIIKVVRKQTAKRDHKQLDYDRHRTTLKKLQDKTDKTLKDEKALYRAEADAEAATQDYNHFNDLLKDDLPRLFQLEAEFIQPLFQSFYYMQLNIFYTLHERMQAIDIGYFDLTQDIEDAFDARRGDVRERAEALTITHFKTTGGKRPVGLSKYANHKLLEGRSSNSSSASPSVRHSLDAAPPPYTQSNALTAPSSSGLGRSNTTGSGPYGAAAKTKGAAPPPPKPKPSRLSGVPPAETVTALYDYEAQAEGDLSFSAGEIIEVIQRTANDNEWWTGRIGSREGQFPGNYVELNE